jgi:succinate-semialdehyde dehydrogenase/glutarate-semialdehyde dehydrogenase
MASLESLNPATGEKVGEVPVTAAADVGGVVAEARSAQPAWRALGLGGRAELLAQACKRFVERADELGALLTREMGKPLAAAIGEVKSCGRKVEKDVAEMSEALADEVVSDGSFESTQVRDPYGVAAAITPWNFPISMPHWMVLPALMAGNTVVLKPSEETPLIAQAYVDVLNEVLPAKVLQVIHGADDQGKALVASEVDLIAFTGSRDVGKKILAAAAPDLKRVVLELGGKDPMVVLDGADLAASARFAAGNSFRNSGQVCVSTERIYVPRAGADEFTAQLIAAAEEMTVGNGMDKGVQIGPMINARQRDHVLAQIDDAVQKGATIAWGGKGHHDNFVMPTVLRGVTHEMNIGREETFGPVACIVEVDSDDEAVRLANDTPFGLGATVFGPDEKAAQVARQLTAGMVGINKSCGGASGTPWVGSRQSGYGFHSGREGHRHFAQLRILTRRIAG